MEEFAKPFYQSQEWKSARAVYLKKVGGLCERCLKKGLYNAAVIVHHRVHLSPETIRDPKIRTGFEQSAVTSTIMPITQKKIGTRKV